LGYDTGLMLENCFVDCAFKYDFPGPSVAFHWQGDDENIKITINFIVLGPISDQKVALF
jgi:hypothetical protein